MKVNKKCYLIRLLNLVNNGRQTSGTAALFGCIVVAGMYYGYAANVCWSTILGLAHVESLELLVSMVYGHGSPQEQVLIGILINSYCYICLSANMFLLAFTAITAYFAIFDEIQELG